MAALCWVFEAQGKQWAGKAAKREEPLKAATGVFPDAKGVVRERSVSCAVGPFDEPGGSSKKVFWGVC